MNWQEVYNKLSDDLVNAFNFFMGNMKLTKVFKATIIEKINDTVYKVSYKNAEYKVKSYYDLIIGDIVWVCAPGGDWDSLFVQSYNGFLDRIITTDKVVNNLTTNVAGTVLDGRMGKSLKDQFDALNSNLTGIQNSFTEIKTVTIYQTRCDNLNGGYVKFGRLVIVSLQIRVLSPGTNFAMLTGFPAPLLGSGNVPVEMNGIKTLSNETTGVFINSVGSLCVRAAVANDYISVSGSYLST
ncbi:hypothetical protein [Lacrimispora indolis]|uniref:hypothetical protein n=1 Tax=Lacrimispora indolis TaxID=69825 RepID=UPI00041C5050|nr:hypothetical protein [[Clostridium] methoxybenzovorans]